MCIRDRIYNAYPSPYTSLADLCDKASFDDLCPHGTHARPSDVLNAFIRDHPGDETEIRILWSGHRMTSNRSYTSYNHYSIFIHDLPDLDIRTEDERYTLLHETAHQFGAPDHYCYDPSQEDSCGNDLCPSHHEEQGLTENCVMGKYIACLLYTSHPRRRGQKGGCGGLRSLYRPHERRAGKGRRND